MSAEELGQIKVNSNNNLTTSPSTDVIVLEEEQSNNKTKKTTVDKKDEKHNGQAAEHIDIPHHHSSDHMVKCDTSCGTIELPPIRIASLSGMFLTIVAFVILAVVIIAAFAFQQNKSLSVIIARGDLLTMREILSYSALFAVYMNNTKYATIHNTTETEYMTILTALIADFPQAFPEHWLERLANNSPRIIENEAIDLVFSGRKSQAVALMESSTYNQSLNEFQREMDIVLDKALQLQQQTDLSITVTGIVGLCVILVVLIIILPLMMAIFSLTINRDSIHNRRLKLANAIMLMDTFQDDKLRGLFKKQCELEHSLENFNFLEMASRYKRISEQSFSIQEKLYGSDESSSSSNGEEHSSKKKEKKREELDHEWKELEKQKLQLAQTLYRDFIDINGVNAVNISKSFADTIKLQLEIASRQQQTQQNNDKVPSLPDDLFDKVMNEVSIVMLDTHHRFKQSLAFQKQMKINKLIGKMDHHESTTR
ncbi:hypothetical protein ABK040_008479 [Willaertia magna]